MREKSFFHNRLVPFSLSGHDFLPVFLLCFLSVGYRMEGNTSAANVCSTTLAFYLRPN
jgi:hypothetical protein